MKTDTMEISIKEQTITLRLVDEVVYSNSVRHALDAIENVDAILMYYIESKCLWLETLYDTKALQGDEKNSAEQKCIQEIAHATKQINIHRTLVEHRNAIIVAHITRF